MPPTLTPAPSRLSLSVAGAHLACARVLAWLAYHRNTPKLTPPPALRVCAARSPTQRLIGTAAPPGGPASTHAAFGQEKTALHLTLCGCPPQGPRFATLVMLP
eukprot:jgi/Tetstr1/458650/TSEL_045043.t1